MSKEKIAIYPGSFDPMTLGHLDVINRASKLFDKIIIGIGNNNSKSSLLSTEEKINVIKSETSHLSNVEVKEFDGLVVDFAKKMSACAMIRGIRTEADFVFEMQLSMANSSMSEGIETIFIPTDPKYMFVSSSLTKEIARFGGDISAFVTERVAGVITSKLQK